MALPLAWSVGVVVGWGGALCFLLSPFSALALVAPASGGWLGASLSLVVVVVHLENFRTAILFPASPLQCSALPFGFSNPCRMFRLSVQPHFLQDPPLTFLFLDFWWHGGLENPC